MIATIPGGSMLKSLMIVLGVLSLPLTASSQAPNTMWTRYYFDGTAAYICWQVIETSDSGLALIGTRRVPPQDLGEIALIKTDPIGDTLWIRYYGDYGVDEGYALLETTDRGFILVGSTSLSYESIRKIYLIKTDSIGNIAWSRIYEDSCNLDMRSIDLTSDGGYIVAGSTNDWIYGDNIFALKTDSLGHEEWRRLYDFGFGHGYSICASADSSYILAGSIIVDEPLQTQAIIMKINSAGDTLWTRTFGNPSYDEEARVAVETSDGDYIVAGDSIGAGMSPNVAIMKFAPDGERRWVKLISGQIMANSTYITRSGDILVAGFGYNSDRFTAFMAKTDSAGELRWLKNFESGEQIDYEGRSILETFDSGCVMLGNMSYPNTTHAMLAKLEPDEDQGIGDRFNQIPAYNALCQNYPNPFNGKCLIEYTLPTSSVVELDIYDILGQKVVTLENGYRLAGVHQVTWESGTLPSGLYFYRLSSAEFSETRKMLLLK
jgi:hypothetical protein